MKKISAVLFINKYIKHFRRLIIRDCEYVHKWFKALKYKGSEALISLLILCRNDEDAMGIKNPPYEPRRVIHTPFNSKSTGYPHFLT